MTAPAFAPSEWTDDELAAFATRVSDSPSSHLLRTETQVRRCLEMTIAQAQLALTMLRCGLGTSDMPKVLNAAGKNMAAAMSAYDHCRTLRAEVEAASIESARARDRGEVQ